jgi:photosystem II Psb28-2 protein
MELLYTEFYIFPSELMTSSVPSIQFFDGLSEELDGVSLRRNRSTGARSVLMTFRQLKSIEHFNSFRNRFSKAMRLVDSEGEIQVEPSSVKFYFGGPEGDDFERMECRFEIDLEDYWERFMRFMNRYAEANGMAYGEPEKKGGEN